MLRAACALTMSSLSILLAAEAQAQSTSRQGLRLGLEGYGYDYEEKFEGATIVEDRGKLFGLSLEYGRAVGGWELRAAGRAAGGLVDYRSDEGDRLEDVAQATVQLELQAGRPITLSPTVTLTPFVGLGSRGHGDASGGLTTDTGLQGYDRYIFYAYAPLGLAADVGTGPRTSISLSGQYNLFLGGDSEAELSKVDPEAPDLLFELEDGSGWEFSAALNYATPRGVVSFGPFFRTWDVEQSSSLRFEDEGLAIELFEPANRTIEAGLKLAFRF